MASWIIVATFVVCAVYLIIRGRNFSPLPMLSSIATAMLMCFFGLLFSAASNALLTQIATPIENPVLQSLLVTVGALLGLIIRHRWKRSASPGQ